MLTEAAIKAAKARENGIELQLAHAERNKVRAAYVSAVQYLCG